MEGEYFEDFQQMKEGVEKLKQAINRFMDGTLTPVFNDIKDFPADIELELHSLVQKSTNLATSFAPLEEKITDITSAGVNFYSVVGFANRLEQAVTEWQSQFMGLKDTWGSIAAVLNESISYHEPVTDSGDVLESIIEECNKIQQSLQEVHLKLFIFRKLSPVIRNVSDQVNELKGKLKDLMNGWLPQKDGIQKLIEPVLEQATHLSQSEINDEAEEKFSSLLERQKNLYEIFARWQLFKKIEPSLQASLSQLENLERSFEEAINEWRPENEEVKNLYQSMLTKYKRLGMTEEERPPISEKYESLKSGFDQFEAEWNSSIKEITKILDKWVNRRY